MFKDLLNEIKGFQYQITLRVLLRKGKENGDIEFAPVYFNSTTKTVINSKYMFKKSFQEILYRIDNYINKEYDWVIESIDAKYVNISTYIPLWPCFYIKLLVKLRKSMKVLINIKNNGNKSNEC